MKDAGRGVPVQAAASGAGIALLLAVGVAFMAYLDTTAVNIAVPALRQSYPTQPLTTLSWVLTGYSVVFASLLTPAGRLADLWGPRRVLLLAMSLFGVGSAVCAAASGVYMLVGARLIQGMGAAGMIPAALGLLLLEVPSSRRTVALSIWGAVSSLASAVGPSLGASLIDVSSWRLIFVINVPIVVVLVVIGHRSIPERGGHRRRLPDMVGTLALTVGLGGVVLAITEGSDWGWTSVATLGSLVVGAVLVGTSVWRSTHHQSAVIAVDLWKNRVFALAGVASAAMGAAMFTWLLISPLFLTSEWHYSVLRAGLGVTPAAVASAVGAIAVGRFAPPSRLPMVMVLGMFAFFVQCIVSVVVLGAHPAYLSAWLPVNVVGGLAVGMTLTALVTAVSAALRPDQFAGGSAMNTTVRQVGGALGVAAVVTILTARHESALDAFHEAFVFSGVVALVVVGAGGALWLSDRRRSRARFPSDEPETGMVHG